MHGPYMLRSTNIPIVLFRYLDFSLDSPTKQLKAQT